MRIGIIGTGFVTDLHLAALKEVKGAEVVAITGRNTAKAAELARPSQARVYDTWLPMLQQERLDVVYILLPPHLHGDLEKACAEHVKGVLVEKPITQSLETAHRCNEYFKKAGTIVSVAYMNRYRAGLAKAKQLFTKDGAGLLANGYWVTKMPGPTWWRTFEQSGGQFSEQCTHLVDASRYILGEIVEVSAFRSVGNMPEVEGYSVDDAMVVNARFASGALGTFATGCFPLSDHPELPGGGIGLALCSRRHRVKFSGWHLDAAIHSPGEKRTEVPREANIFVEQSRAFLDAVRSGDASGIRSTYEDGMKTLAVTIAATESARNRQGAPVKVAL
jgi:myo-inositol 2-dehydrogenase/D-chiro-inositol 1-dehydrogenase